MKKTLLLFLLLFPYYYALNAQRVQERFFGYCFYSEISFLEDAMNKRGYTNQKGLNELKAYDVSFGGYNWPFVTFSFFKNQMYCVSFSNNCKTKKESQDLYNSLLSSLKSKYGELCSNLQYGEGIIVHDGSRCLILDTEYSSSKGGDMYYYVSLNYYHVALWDKCREAEKNEL